MLTGLGWALLAVAALAYGVLLYGARASAGQATDALREPPLDRTQGATAVARRDMYATAQMLDVLAAGVAILVFVTALIVALFSGIGPATVLGAVGGLAGIVAAVIGVRHHGALIERASERLSDLHADGLVESYPPDGGPAARPDDTTTHGGAR